MCACGHHFALVNVIARTEGRRPGIDLGQLTAIVWRRVQPSPRAGDTDKACQGHPWLAYQMLITYERVL